MMRPKPTGEAMEVLNLNWPTGGQLAEDWNGIKESQREACWKIITEINPMIALPPHDPAIQSEASSLPSYRVRNRAEFPKVGQKRVLDPNPYGKPDMERKNPQQEAIRQTFADPKTNLGRFGADYYDAGGISTMDVIEAKLGASDVTPYQAGLWFNVIKYALRWPFKGQARKDLGKVVHYATMLLETL